VVNDILSSRSLVLLRVGRGGSMRTAKVDVS
jgi:hypothetical protein